LQDAAVIFHDETLDEGVLELARRDAERVAVTRCPRGDLVEFEKALSKGSVVVIGTAKCSLPGSDCETILATPD
jgi:hypothetical protein